MIRKSTHALHRARGRRRLVAIATLEYARRRAVAKADTAPVTVALTLTDTGAFPAQGGRHRRAAA